MGRTMSRSAIIALITIGWACPVHAQDYLSLAVGNSNLSPDEVAALEQKVELDANDIASRVKLLGYYFLARSHSDAANSARRKHILWLIEHASTLDISGSPYAGVDHIADPEGYAQAKAAWLKQIEANPDDVRVLDNAAKFFTLSDRDRAIESLEKAHTLDQKNPEWLERLGHIHFLGMHSNSSAERMRAAKTALEYFESALGLSAPKDDHLLVYVAKSALAADESTKARGYAKQMLNKGDSGWNAGINIHHGNIVLGRLALREGNIEEAKKHLLAAGKTPGAPTLNSFGPNMSLALELLEAGERDVVLEYFELCSKFWDREELDVWTKEVKEGRIPGFGANLRY